MTYITGGRHTGKPLIFMLSERRKQGCGPFGFSSARLARRLVPDRVVIDKSGS